MASGARLADIFSGTNRIIIAGNLDKWTMEGKTKMSPGNYVDLSIPIDGQKVTAIFQIKAVTLKKLAELTNDDFIGNAAGAQAQFLDHADLKGPDTECIVIDFDNENPRLAMNSPVKIAPDNSSWQSVEM